MVWMLFGVLSVLTCEEVARVGDSTRTDCIVPTDSQKKKIHILKLKGPFERAAYAHGRLTFDLVEDGIIQEVTERLHRSLNSSNAVVNGLMRSIFGCFFKGLHSSVSNEFIQAMRAFHRGYEEGQMARRQKTKYSRRDVEAAALGVDISIAAEGLSRKLEDSPVSATLELLQQCGLQVPISAYESLLRSLAHLGTAARMGCLGFVIPASQTIEDHLIHGRNLDGDLAETWHRAPILFVIEEPGYFKYAGVGSAGLLFPGAISGINEKGLSITLHEMSTTKYRIKAPQEKGVTAPFLQQRILREASSIDEAIEIVKSANHFGAWTLFISDGKTQEVASIEFSGEKIQVARRTQDQAMGQTNHFLGSEMQDQFFTPNFNKFLETESRLRVIDAALKKDQGYGSVRWAIDQLAGHKDAYEGFRSFGRTATKVYTVQSTVTRPTLNEIWMTVNERHPASHSTFVGFKVNWETLEVTQVGQSRTSLFRYVPNWELSLSRFNESRILYEKGSLHEALMKLTVAILLAQRDEYFEFPYYFMRARIEHQIGFHEAAHRDWEFLLSNRDQLHPYGAALALMYSVATDDALFAKAKDKAAWNQKRMQRLGEAEATMKSLYAETSHFDLKKKLNIIGQLKKGKSPKLPKLDFVTIE